MNDFTTPNEGPTNPGMYSSAALGAGRSSSDDDDCGAKVVGVELEDLEPRSVHQSPHVPVPPAPPLGSVLRRLKEKTKKLNEYDNDLLSPSDLRARRLPQKETK